MTWQGRRRPHRAAVLAIWSALTCAYGAGLIAGYRPTFTAALHLDVAVFAWAFIAAAIIVATGIFTRTDRWQFAVGELASAGWGLLLCTHWTQPYGWASGMSWMMTSAMLLVVSFWREPPTIINPPDPEP